MNKNLVERYLRQELSETELQDFTFQLAMDKELRKEVEATRVVFNTLKTMPGNAGAGAPSSNRIMWLLGLMALVLGALFLYSIFNDEEQPSEPVEKVRAIAFAENEFFEQLILADEHRNTAYQLSIEIPSRTDILELKNTVIENIPLKGKVIWNQNPSDFQVCIYSNKWEDFENETPIYKAALALKSVATNSFIIDQTLNYDLQAGLYYFTIETVNEGEPIGGGKFLVVD